MRGKKSQLKQNKRPALLLPPVSQPDMLFDNYGCNLANLVVSSYPQLDTVSQYALERIYQRLQINRLSSWHKDKNGHTLTAQAAKLIDKELEIFNSLTPDQRMGRSLVHEYGFLLAKLSKAEYKVKAIDYKQLSFGQKRHLENLNLETKELYKNRLDATIDFPLGLVVPIANNNFRVIDGYHRLSQAVQIKPSSLNVIVAIK